MEDNINYQYIQSELDKLKISFNPNLQKMLLDMFQNGMSYVPENQLKVANFLYKIIVINSIDSLHYDEKFQKYLNSNDLHYFSKLSTLLDSSIKKIRIKQTS